MGDAVRKRGVVVQLKLPRGRRIRGHVAGFLVGYGERGPLVDYAGNSHGPLVARTTVPLDSVVPDAAATTRYEVLLVFEHEQSDQPVIVGLLSPTAPEQTQARALEEGRTERLETVIDGRRVVLDAKDEIVLRCGEASITLRRNGRVVIRGTYVETRSRGVNRIKGGSVQIN